MKLKLAPINIEKRPKGYGSRVYWVVYYGWDSARKRSEMFTNKRKAVEFARNKREDTSSCPPWTDMYVDFMDGSNKQNRDKFAAQEHWKAK